MGVGRKEMVRNRQEVSSSSAIETKIDQTPPLPFKKCSFISACLFGREKGGRKDSFPR